MGHPFINAPDAMRLAGVSHFETIWDDTTDTHCVLGWSETQVVVAFRWVLHVYCWCTAGWYCWGAFKKQNKKWDTLPRLPRLPAGAPSRCKTC